MDASPSKPGVLLIAHRGGEGRWPSNTLHAFQQSLALGADMLEMDIHTSADGVLVIRHDPTVDSTTNGSGRIRGFNLSELEKLDAGYTWTDDAGRSFPFRAKGITIPTLEEVFTAFPDAQLNIDIKEKEKGVVEHFCKMLGDFGRLEQVVVGSFHENQLSLFRSECPQVRTAAGVRETRSFYLLSRSRLHRFYRPPAWAFQVPEAAGRLRLVTPRFIQAAHAHGLLVHIWTVNDTKDMQRLIAWGVDGIMSDYPDRLAEVLGRQPTDMSRR